eukprot:CAMPEP_0184705320 /NCGR_PEP_ID=MMETSP0313-20130426/33952_1 /TAXON_ID=2792 /ORGANISM="Porphyridium aerugineum, Strain SAG 1380-2" /LENGTH=36 /DNA_ID= /DNA_START= /DNA_END= /DNA_ORIENTATION=
MRVMTQTDSAAFSGGARAGGSNHGDGGGPASPGQAW